jgi:hypothetical protein
MTTTRWQAAVGTATLLLLMITHLTTSSADAPVESFPPVVTPGTAGAPPGDAVVLFDGTDLSAFEGEHMWPVEDGAMTAERKDLYTRQVFGDMQLHLEFATPANVRSGGQGRGNSGVKIMTMYEIQVLDSYENRVKPDAMCGALYSTKPPDVNACRGPGDWQTLDVVWHAPRFDDKGKLLQPAEITAFQNGVLIHDRYELPGIACWNGPKPYKRHPPRLPLRLQYHGSPVRYRNIWVRNLEKESVVQ